MKLHRSEKLKVRANLDMTPMIDCVFQLILFFMLSSTFVVQRSINIEMPEAKGPVALEQKDVSITLAYAEYGNPDEGLIYVNETQVTKPELSRVLAARLTEQPDLMVLIRTDRRVATSRLVEILGIASSVGIKRFGIAAQPLPEEL
jgi:biopolymer transport protein ExbD